MSLTKEIKPLYEEKTCGCPICDSVVKYKKYDFKQVEYYMDGQPKLPFAEYIQNVCFCEKCGFVFKPNSFNEDDVISKDLMSTVNSKEFKEIFNSEQLSQEEKFLNIIEKLENIKGNGGAIHFIELLKLWYYQENKNKEEILSQIQNAINENIKFENIVHTSHISQNQLYYNNKLKSKDKELRVNISKEEMLIDFYRQLGNFEKANEILKYCIDNYNLKSDVSKGHLTYFKYQKKLIEEKNSEHL